ncbi:MAG: glycerophosphodiester phosphodiesterase family protein [Planctomycetota bacterium]
MIDRLFCVALLTLFASVGLASGQVGSDSQPSTLVIGHRGVPGFGGENTTASLALAVELGADGVELDLVLTKDQQLAVLHDWTLNRVVGEDQLLSVYPDRARTIDGRRVWLTRDFTMAELKRLSVIQAGPRADERPFDPNDPGLRIVSYRDALRAFQRLRQQSPGIRLYTEIKTSADHLSPEEVDLCADRVAEALAATGETERPESHWLQSFDSRVMDRLAARPELDRFEMAMLLSCEPGVRSGANPVVLDVESIQSDDDLRAFLARHVAGRGMEIVHGWKVMWWHLLAEKGIDCVGVADELELQIHAFTFRDHRFASDYSDRPVLVPSGSAPFASAEHELEAFMKLGFDAVMSDTVDSAIRARAAAHAVDGVTEPTLGSP